MITKTPTVNEERERLKRQAEYSNAINNAQKKILIERNLSNIRANLKNQYTIENAKN